MTMKNGLQIKKNPVVKFYSKYSVLRTLTNETQSQVVRILQYRRQTS